MMTATLDAVASKKKDKAEPDLRRAMEAGEPLGEIGGRVGYPGE